MLEYTSLAKHSGLSRHTVKAHIEAMSIAHAVFLLAPFHGGARRELTHRPKAYAFDTGFVAFEKGWHDIRDEDRGLLWEHLTLDALRFRHQGNTIFYWADKSGREIDFVCKRARGLVDAFECKIDPDRFSPDSLQIFRGFYPEGDNYVVSPYVKTTFQRRFNDLVVQFISLEELMRLNDTPEET